MLEKKDIQTIGKLLDEKLDKKLKENNKILKDGIVAEVGAVTSEAFSAVEAKIDNIEKEIKLRPTLNQIMSWGDKKIIPLELDIDKIKYLHRDEMDNLPPPEEISKALLEKGLKQKPA